MQKFGKFCLENANSWHFDVEISLAKGIIFRKIGLANGAILKQWAAHPCPKFSREPPPVAPPLSNSLHTIYLDLLVFVYCINFLYHCINFLWHYFLIFVV